MGRLIPVVGPLDNNQLTTDVDVRVTVNYADVGSCDAVHVRWGTYPMLDTDGPTPDDPVASIPVPPCHICDGHVVVWFSAQDELGNIAYSDPLPLSIETGGKKLLRAASVEPVDADAPAGGMRVTVPESLEFALTLDAGDLLTVYWDIYLPPGDAPQRSSQRDFRLAQSAGACGFTTPPLIPVPKDPQFVVVYYSVLKAIAAGTDSAGVGYPHSEQMFRSQSVTKHVQDLWPGSPSPMFPAPLFLDAVDGVIDLAVVTGDVRIEIPSTDAIRDVLVTFYGDGKDPGTGAAYPGSHWQSAPVVVPQTPYNGTPVPRRYVEAVPDGGTYVVYYIARAAASAMSEAVTIRHGSRPPSGDTGSLWGWGDSAWGTLD